MKIEESTRQDTLATWVVAGNALGGLVRRPTLEQTNQVKDVQDHEKNASEVCTPVSDTGACPTSAYTDTETWIAPSDEPLGETT